MVLPLLQQAAVGRFNCLGAECPDTCCGGWDMPVDRAQLARYREQAPELLETVDLANGCMKKNAAATHCAQLQGGLCAIQNKRGPDFLGDSCHFYPRIVHAIGGRQLMVGSTSCPEMLRLMLSDAAPFTREAVTLERMPGIRRDILPEGMEPDHLLATIDSYMQLASDEGASPEAIMLRIIDHACEGMEEGISKPTGPHAIYYALALTEAFSASPRRPALDAVMQGMEQQLGCRFHRGERSIELLPLAASKLSQLHARWNANAATTAPILRRWIEAQLAMTAFPFGGLPGLSPFERTALLVQRFATMRLGLMCHMHDDTTLDDATAIRVIQVLSRFMDHLADAKLTQMMFRDLGWTTPAQLRAIIS